jgi:AraC-like DNA-binding protein
MADTCKILSDTLSTLPLREWLGHTGRVDALAEVLRVTRVKGAVMAQVIAGDPWGIDIAQSTGAALHAVSAGTAWLRMEGSRPRQLMPGDIVLLPKGAAHAIASAPAGPTIALDRFVKAQMLTPGGELRVGGDGACSRFLCAGYDYDHEVAQPLMAALPTIVHVPAGEHGPGTPGDDAGSVLRMLTGELTGHDAGFATAVDRLLDVLLVQILRAWLARPDASAGASWLIGLRDPVTAGALTRLHAEPANPWTSDSLARAVGVSRATLARRFHDIVGEAPLTYLTRWRMDLAAQALRETDRPVDVIGREVGYTSEFAFNRAFSRVHGSPPGRYRSAVRARHRTPAPPIADSAGDRGIPTVATGSDSPRSTLHR